MNDSTTLDKTIKTILWVAVSAAVTAVLTYISGKPELFNPLVVSVVNVLLVAGKNFADPQVKNI